MDRLLESTRVSNVMRRRELPMAVAQPVQSVSGAAPRAAAVQRMQPSSRPAAIGPRRFEHHVGGMSREGNWAKPRQPAGGQPAPREYRMLRHRPLRQVEMPHRARIAVAGSQAADPVKRPAPLGPAPRKGRALRVSMAAGFRLPKLPRHQYPARHVAPPALEWDESAHFPQPRLKRLKPRSYGEPLATPQSPGVFHKRFAVMLGFRWPGLQRLAAPRVSGLRSLRAFPAAGRDDLQPVLTPFRPSIASAGFGAGFARNPHPPSSADAVPRIATVRFDSQYLQEQVTQ